MRMIFRGINKTKYHSNLAHNKDYGYLPRCNNSTKRRWWCKGHSESLSFSQMYTAYAGGGGRGPRGTVIFFINVVYDALQFSHGVVKKSKFSNYSL